jgi:hypothetical protein
MVCKLTAIRFAGLMVALLPFAGVQGQYVPTDSLPPVPGISVQALVTSPATYVMGADPRMWRWGAVVRFGSSPYKRQRVGVFYDVLNGSGDDQTDELTEITHITDSTVSFNYQQDASRRLTARYGWEWTHPIRRIAPYYAIEIIGGFQRDNDTRKEITVGVDTAATSIVPDANRFLSERTYRCDRVEYWLLGASFTAGWRFQIAKGWMVSIQLSPEVYIPVYRSTSACGGLPVQVAAGSGADVRLRIGEVLIGWTF